MPKSAMYIDTGDITINRNRGNAASADAFERSRPTHQRDSLTVYGLICAAPDGMTSKEVAERMGKPLNAVSGRLAELERDGMIRGTGRRRESAEVHVAMDGKQMVLGGAA